MSSPITQGIFNVRRMEKKAKGRKDMVVEEGGEWKGRNEERVKGGLMKRGRGKKDDEKRKVMEVKRDE